MKKKLLGMSLAVMLSFCTVVPVSAQQLHADGESAEVTVSYDNPSIFCINIPETIDGNDPSGYYFSADYVKILDTEQVSIYPPEESIIMTNQFGETGYLRFYPQNNGIMRFLRNETTTNIPLYSQFDGMDAGHYEGTATFTIRLEGIKE